MKNIRNIQLSEFDQAYHIFELSFDPSELRLYDDTLHFFKNQEIQILGYFEEHTMLGAMIIWNLKTCVFLENFATLPEVRGKGIGSNMLLFVQEKYSNRYIILEVEKPFDSMSKRRIEFYKRNHFKLSSFSYFLPPLRKEVCMIPLIVMSFPSVMKESEFLKIKNDIFKQVYKQKEDSC